MTPATSTSTHGDLRERMSQACHHCGFWTFADLLAAVQTDWWIRIPAIRLAEAHAKAASGTYMYEFAWPSPGLGAVHALEIPFVFDNLGKDTPLVGPLLGDNPPQELPTGCTPPGSPLPPTVPRVGRHTMPRRATMRFDAISQVVDDPRAWERALWEGVR